MSDNWPPIDARLKTLPVAVAMTDDELTFRATDATLSWKLLRELLWFFNMPADQQRLLQIAAGSPKASPELVREWVAWSNQHKQIHPDLQSQTQRSIEWDEAAERREGEAGPTYVVRRADNDPEWTVIRKYFGPLNGCQPTTAEIIDRAFDVKRETMTPEERGRFFHSYIA